MESSASLSVACQFAIILNGLMAAIAARWQDYPWTGALVTYAWTRVTKINQRFQRLAALIQAGQLRPERFSWPRPPRAPSPRPDAGAGTSAPRFGVAWLFGTHQFGWLCRWMPPKPYLPGAGIASASLRALLETPEMKALLAATPRMRKLLRPLCWMLCIEATLLPPPPRRISSAAKHSSAPQGVRWRRTLVGRGPRRVRRAAADGAARIDDAPVSRRGQARVGAGSGYEASRDFSRP